MIYQAANYIYLLSLLFASVCSLSRFRAIDKASKILSVLISCAFINECAAFLLAKLYHNNLVLYNIYSFIEFAILSMYFNNIIDVFIKKNVGVYIGVAGIVLGVLNLIFLQHLDSFNSYFYLFEALTVIGMSLFAFFRLLLKHDSLTLYTYHHFWFVSILLFFWSITFLCWGLYDYINQQLRQSARNINTALAIVGIITYTALGCVFLLYPKMKSVNE